MTRTKWISCNACGVDDARELGCVGDWHIRACNQCELVYVNPIPFFEPTREFSKMSLDFQYTRFQRDVTPEILAHDEAQFRRQSQLMRGWTGRDGPGRLLELGCGSGSVVHAAARLGWEALGIDIDPALVEVGQRKLGANLRCGTLPDASLPDSSFDFIRLRDVIEHLPNPLEVLVDIERILAPGGILLVATPNEGSLPARVRAAAGVPRSTVATVNPPHHLHGFTPATVERIVRRAGLRPVATMTTTPVDPLYVTARNMREAGWNLRTATWRVGKLLGMGSMLVCWAAKAGGAARNEAVRARA